MKHTLTEIGMCRNRLVVECEPSEVDEAFMTGYAELDGMVQVKGFRKGKAPRRFLEKKYGKEIAEDAAQRMAMKFVPEILKAEDLSMLGEVGKLQQDKNPEPGKPYSFNIEFDVKPKFELPEYKGLLLKETVPLVTDEEVEKRLAAYRINFADFDHTEEPCADGDIVEADVSAMVDSEQILDLKDQRIRASGVELFGLPCPELVASLVGRSAGDVVKVGIRLPEDHPTENLRGRESEVVLTIKKVLRQRLPNFDDAFAESVGMKDMATFRRRIRLTMERERGLRVREELEGQAIDQLLSAVQFDLPAGFVQREADAWMQQRRMQMARSGMSTQAIENEMGRLTEEAHKAAIRQGRWSVIADAISEKEKVEITADEVGRHIDALAQAFKTTPPKMLKRIQDNDGMPQVVQEIRTIKIMRLIIESAKIDRPEGAETAQKELESALRDEMGIKDDPAQQDAGAQE